ncbi:hypothetical protein VCHA53O466_50501 [Vibrio chagasii]|nr:hypothetical protein VCHA53O466_50501 [Vibrio chagasii]
MYKRVFGLAFIAFLVIEIKMNPEHKLFDPLVHDIQKEDFLSSDHKPLDRIFSATKYARAETQTAIYKLLDVEHSAINPPESTITRSFKDTTNDVDTVKARMLEMKVRDDDSGFRVRCDNTISKIIKEGNDIDVIMTALDEKAEEYLAKYKMDDAWNITLESSNESLMKTYSNLLQESKALEKQALESSFSNMKFAEGIMAQQRLTGDIVSNEFGDYRNVGESELKDATTQLINILSCDYIGEIQ